MLAACTRSSVVALAVAVAVLSAPAIAGAQVEDELAIERFRLAAERTGILDVESGDVPGHGQWDLGIWVSASRSPLTVDAPAGESGRLVDERVAGSLVASIALWQRVVLGFDMPLVISQDDDLDAGGGDIDRFGVGDVRFAVKAGIVARPVAIALLVSLSLPSGDPDGFIGESEVTIAPELAVSRRFGANRIAVDVGYLRRGERQLFDTEVDDELSLRAGAARQLGDPRRPVCELAATVGLATPASAPLDGATRSHSELLVGATGGIGGAVVGFAAAGVGLWGDLGTPDWRAVAGIRIGTVGR